MSTSNPVSKTSNRKSWFNSDKKHVGWQAIVNISTLAVTPEGRDDSPKSPERSRLSVLGEDIAANLRSPIQAVHNKHYMNHDIRKYLREVYDELRDGQEFVTRPQLVEFMTKVQNQAEPLQRSATGQDRREKVYKFEDFLAWLHRHERLEAVKPLPALEELNPSWPISSYYINSSHNTFLEGDQLTSKSTVEAYRKVRAY